MTAFAERPNPGIDRQSRLLAEEMIEDRSRAYAIAPKTLDDIEEGLSCMKPSDMLDRIISLIAFESTKPRRSGDGSEVISINIYAAMRYAARLVNIKDGLRL